jgi:hypothetical protein
MEFAFKLPKDFVSDPVVELVRSSSVRLSPSFEIEAIIDRAKKRFAHIESNGLRVCRHQNGDLRGCVLTTLDLSPHVVAQHIGKVLGVDCYNSVESRYYGGLESDQKAIAHGFTKADIGTVFYVVEAVDGNMPGHLEQLPGSLCANMDWGKERNDLFEAFCEQYKAAGVGRAVDYLSHSLIYLHDLNRGLYGDTLAAASSRCFVDYIHQDCPDEFSHPYGLIDAGIPYWSAADATANINSAPVILMS